MVHNVLIFWNGRAYLIRERMAEYKTTLCYLVSRLFAEKAGKWGCRQTASALQWSFGTNWIFLSVEKSESLYTAQHSKRLFYLPQIKKIFIEPHLKQRLGLQKENKIRFHGCGAVRYDDHKHVQLQSRLSLILLSPPYTFHFNLKHQHRISRNRHIFFINRPRSICHF